MCGIIGYVGERPCEEIIVAGLEKLEYRGYDSAGVAILIPEGVEKVRAVGNLANLREKLAAPDLAGLSDSPTADGAWTGVGHTRWATHGRVTEANCHPHSDESGDVQIALNGIVENHADIRSELESEGYVFSSETDAEVVAHLIAKHFDGDLTEAVRATYRELRLSLIHI